jgi:aryl-alcohol dehydrogenase-like predicted oxidoreductase
MQRQLGKSGISVSAMGLGCWAIGGWFTLDGKADGYGDVDDEASIRAIRRAVDLGITFFDTSDAYGTGHSEELLGRALKGRRADVAIATKFGYRQDPGARALTGTDTSGEYARRALEESLRRLHTDYVDLYQLHVGEIPPGQIDEVFGTLDDLRAEGLIRAYGWSTYEPELVRQAASRWELATVQHQLNVLADDQAMIEVAAANDLASICSMPLAMGFLSGKFDADSRLAQDDVRGSGHAWVRYFENGRPKPEFLDALAAIREVLRSDGRTLVQGALAWIWARSGRTIPIPGFKNERQVEENAGALAFGPLTPTQMAEIDAALGRSAPGGRPG